LEEGAKPNETSTVEMSNKETTEILLELYEKLDVEKDKYFPIINSEIKTTPFKGLEAQPKFRRAPSKKEDLFGLKKRYSAQDPAT
jgi:hypothetical protein